MTGLPEKEKERLRGLVPFDLAKKFVGNFTKILEMEEVDWMYLPNKTSLKNGVLTMAFKLKESEIEKEIERRDRAQKKIDEIYNETPGTELETIPTEE